MQVYTFELIHFKLKCKIKKNRFGTNSTVGTVVQKLTETKILWSKGIF